MNQCEPVTVSYGRKSNANLLLHYGFAYQNNPYDYVELQLNEDNFYYLKDGLLNVDLIAALRKQDEPTELVLEMKAVFVYKELCV